MKQSWAICPAFHEAEAQINGVALDADWLTGRVSMRSPKLPTGSSFPWNEPGEHSLAWARTSNHSCSFVEEKPRPRDEEWAELF